MAQEETQQCTPQLGRDPRVSVFLFLVFFILLGKHEIRRLDFGKIPPTRETFRWTTAADRGLFFLDPGLFLVSRMMFYDLNDGYTPGMRRVSFLFSFLANQFYLPA